MRSLKHVTYYPTCDCFLCPSPSCRFCSSHSTHPPITNVPFSHPVVLRFSASIFPTTLPLIYKSHESGSAVQSHCNAESFVISSLHLLFFSLVAFDLLLSTTYSLSRPAALLSRSCTWSCSYSHPTFTSRPPIRFPNTPTLEKRNPNYAPNYSSLHVILKAFAQSLLQEPRPALSRGPI